MQPWATPELLPGTCHRCECVSVSCLSPPPHRSISPGGAGAMVSAHRIPCLAVSDGLNAPHFDLPGAMGGGFMGCVETEAGSIPQITLHRGLARGLVPSFLSPEPRVPNLAIPCFSRVSESLALSGMVDHTLLSSPLRTGLRHCLRVTGKFGAQEGRLRMCWVWIPNSGQLEQKAPCLFVP